MTEPVICYRHVTWEEGQVGPEGSGYQVLARERNCTTLCVVEQGGKYNTPRERNIFKRAKFWSPFDWSKFHFSFGLTFILSLHFGKLHPVLYSSLKLLFFRWQKKAEMHFFFLLFPSPFLSFSSPPDSLSTVRKKQGKELPIKRWGSASWLDMITLSHVTHRRQSRLDYDIKSRVSRRRRKRKKGRKKKKERASGRRWWWWWWLGGLQMGMLEEEPRVLVFRGKKEKEHASLVPPCEKARQACIRSSRSTHFAAAMGSFRDAQWGKRHCNFLSTGHRVDMT